MTNRTPRSMVALDRDECLALLATVAVGRVVVPLGASAQPVIRPVHYVFDPVSQSVVFRSVEGSKLYALLHSTRATFEIDSVDAGAHTGWSVIIQGVSEPVHDTVEIRRLERLAPDNWFTATDARWIRIRARTVTGRRLG